MMKGWSARRTTISMKIPELPLKSSRRLLTRSIHMATIGGRQGSKLCPMKTATLPTKCRLTTLGLYSRLSALQPTDLRGLFSRILVARHLVVGGVLLQRTSRTPKMWIPSERQKLVLLKKYSTYQGLIASLSKALGTP